MLNDLYVTQFLRMLSLYNNIEIRKRKGDSSARNEYCNKNIALIDACDISVCVQKSAILENKRELFDYSIFINDSKIRKADYRKFSFTCKKRRVLHPRSS